MKFLEMDFFDDIDVTPLIKKAQDTFKTDRDSVEYQEVYTKKNPLVSVSMTTFNKGSILTNFSLKSVLNQTYKNIEVIIVGDNCTDNTKELLSKIKDDRVTFINLLAHPAYPTDPKSRWLVAGVYPANVALSLLNGDFTTFLDDDDSFVPDRIEKLVNFIQDNRYDIVHHPFTMSENINNCIMSNSWVCGQITTSALFMHNWFNKLLYDSHSWKIGTGEPGDWNRCKKIYELGAKIGRYPEILTIKKESTTLSTWYNK